MLKRIILAAGILVTLGTAVSGSSSDTAQTAKQSRTGTTMQLSSPDAGRLLAEWNARSASPVFVPMARPL